MLRLKLLRLVEGSDMQRDLTWVGVVGKGERRAAILTETSLRDRR